MKNVLFSITATALLFSAAINYAFLSGKCQFSAPEKEDYLTQISAKRAAR